MDLLYNSSILTSITNKNVLMICVWRPENTEHEAKEASRGETIITQVKP